MSIYHLMNNVQILFIPYRKAYSLRKAIQRHVSNILPINNKFCYIMLYAQLRNKADIHINQQNAK
jgi:hypothetical protein